MFYTFYTCSISLTATWLHIVQLHGITQYVQIYLTLPFVCVPVLRSVLPESLMYSIFQLQVYFSKHLLSFRLHLPICCFSVLFPISISLLHIHIPVTWYTCCSILVFILILFYYTAVSHKILNFSIAHCLVFHTLVMESTSHSNETIAHNCIYRPYLSIEVVRTRRCPAMKWTEERTESGWLKVNASQCRE